MKINAALVAITMACFLVPTNGQDKDALTLVQTIVLPDVQGGLNHMSVDAEHRRLFAPAPSDGKLEIVDLTSGKPWRSLNSERPAAARFAAEFNQLYVSSGRHLYIYDGDNFGLIANLDLGSRLDQIAYDASAKELYVGCMTTGETAIAVIAIPERKLLRRISLPSSPQGIAVDLQTGRLFANLPDDSQVAVASRDGNKIQARWHLKGASDNFPITFDEADRHLFLACRTPPQLQVLDTRFGNTIAHVPCAGEADDMWYDGARQRVYVSGSDGVISVIEHEASGRLRVLGSVATAPGAATSVLSTQLDSLYVAVPRDGNKPAKILVFKPVGRP